MVGVTLALRLLVAADGDCYFVTNTRILIVPSCDVSSATIEALTEDPGPPERGRIEPQRRGPGARPGRSLPRAMRSIDPAGEKQLRRKLEIAQAQRISAVAERLSAERARDLAIQERDAARRRLAAAREELAAARARRQAEAAAPRNR
jgi:hypothetical protein